jgi:hypothetical protein
VSTSPVTLDFSKLQPVDGQQGQPAAPAMVSTGTVGNPNTGVVQAPAPTPPPNNAPQGVTLDFSKLQPVSGSGAGTSTQSPDPSLQMNPDDGIGTTVAKGANAVGAGIGEGLLRTLNGGAEMLHLPHQLLQQRQQELEQENANNPNLNAVGYGGETLAEFLMGDEALQGLSMSERLLQTAKTMKTLEKSPRLLQVLKTALATGGRTAAVQGTLSMAHTGGDLGQSAEDAALAGAGGSLLSGLTSAVEAAPSIIRQFKQVPVPDAVDVQPALQNGIREVLAKVADEAGVTPKPTDSIQDIAGNTADAIQAKSKGIYQKLDDATGGNFSRFETKLKNINRQLRETAGLDDDQESALEQKRNEIETSQAQAFEDAKAKGVDPNLIDQARLTWKQSQALFDLERHIQMATDGVHPEDAIPGSSPEVVDPERVFQRLRKMRNSGRLQEAVGKDNASQLIRHADTARQTIDAAQQNAAAVAQQNVEAANRLRKLKTAAKIAIPSAVGAGVGGEAVRAVLGH